MNARSPGRLALVYLARRKLLLAAAVFWRAVFVLVPMQVPILTGAIVDGLTDEPVSVYGLRWQASSAQEIVFITTVGLLLVAVAYAISSYAQVMAGARLSRWFVLEIRRELAAKTMQLSIAQHQHYGAGDLLERIIGDTAELRQFIVRVFIQSLTNVARVGYPIVMMFLIDPSLSLIALSILPAQLLLSRYLQLRLHRATRTSRASNSDLTSVAKESLDGIETLKTLCAENQRAQVICDSAGELESAEVAAHRFSALNNANVWLMTSLSVAATWYLGAGQVQSGNMTLGTLIVFTGFLAFAHRPFRQFTTIASTYRKGLVSLERIGQVLDEPNPLPEAEQAGPLQIEAGQIRLENVAFAYDAKPVLSDISLDIPSGVCTAIVGQSGSGKSSLMRLIARLYDPCQGQVLIDGQAIDQCQLSSVRQQIAAVPQRPMIFTGTIAENIALARPQATQQELEQACREAGAHDFIQQLPRGYATRVGRKGAQLSGGQAQRIAMARALLSQAKIMLLDEPTAGLDAESETILLNTLRNLRGKMTIVVIGHRGKTVAAADHVVVLEQGEVIGQGSHELLRDTCQRYNELFDWESLRLPDSQVYSAA